MQMRLNIRSKISIIAATGLIIISALSLYYVRISYLEKIELMALQSLKTNKEIFNNFLKNDSIKLSVASEILTRDKNAKQLFLQKERQELLNYCLPEFDNLNKKFNITHWYFINPEPDKTCFLRLHRPDMKDDTIKRKTFLKCVKTKKHSVGLELGSRAFAYRVVRPYYDFGKLIGYIEISEAMQDFSKFMKTKTNNDYVLMISKKFLNEKKWKASRKKYPKMADWDEMEDVILINRTTNIINFKSFNCNLNNIKDKGSIFNKNLVIDNQIYILGAFPIKDAVGNKVGALFYINPVTKIYNSMMKELIINTIFFGIITIFLIFIISFIMKISIVRPIENAKIFIKELAAGNFRADLEINSYNEISDMMNNLKTMISNMSKTLSIIKTDIGNVKNSSVETDITSKQLAEGTKKQVSSINNISSAVQEILHKIQMNNKNVKETENYYKSVNKNMKIGKESFNTTKKSMHKIVSKIELISDIAFTTNILAINTAIEAARAGEHGKGFSAVADEVSRLAENSMKAAEIINELSGSSVKNAENLGHVFDLIIVKMQETTGRINEISVAGTEQNMSIKKINSAIDDLHKLSKNNEKYSIETEHNAENLSNLSKQILKTISFYKF